jgi:hypothetical protein
MVIPFLFKMDDEAHVAMYPAILSSNTYLCTSYLRNSKVYANDFGQELRLKRGPPG